MPMETTLTDLETRLACPGGDSLRDSLLARARGLERSARASMVSGLPRQDFPLWQAAADAAAAAQETLAAWPVNDTQPDRPSETGLPFPNPR